MMQSAIMPSCLPSCLRAFTGVAFSLALIASAGAAAAIPCVGDCGMDGSVTVDEIVVGVSIALGQSEADRCLMFDRSRDGVVTVDEILAAVAAALGGCSPNQSPVTDDLPNYRTYPGQEVRIQLPGSDPDGDVITFGVTDPPLGVVIDESSGVMTWQPGSGDVGSYLIEYSVIDDGLPRRSATARLALEVLAADSCLALECDPATGCTSTPLEVVFDCCPAARQTRNLAPLLDCPDGAQIALGRNFDGFGPLENCDILPLSSQGQGGTTASLHIAPRCIRTDLASSMRVQLYTADDVLVNLVQSSASFQAADNGFVVQLRRRFGVNDDEVEPALLEGDEAQLVVTVQDANGLFLEKTIRVLLTLEPVDDLPDDESSPLLPP